MQGIPAPIPIHCAAQARAQGCPQLPPQLLLPLPLRLGCSGVGEEEGGGAMPVGWWRHCPAIPIQGISGKGIPVRAQNVKPLLQLQAIDARGGGGCGGVRGGGGKEGGFLPAGAREGPRQPGATQELLQGKQQVLREVQGGAV